jgi:hypothetical protein
MHENEQDRRKTVPAMDASQTIKPKICFEEFRPAD